MAVFQEHFDLVLVTVTVVPFPGVVDVTVTVLGDPFVVVVDHLVTVILTLMVKPEPLVTVEVIVVPGPAVVTV